MANASNTVEIVRPPAAVYAFLADGLNNPKWRPGVLEIALASGTAGAEGAVYSQKIKGPMGAVPGDYRLAEARPHARIRFEVVAGPARPTGVFEIAPTERGTRLTFTLSLEPKGLMRLMNGVIQKTMESEVANLARLKEVLERT